jgi:hypothetical protein
VAAKTTTTEMERRKIISESTAITVASLLCSATEAPKLAAH